METTYHVVRRSVDARQHELKVNLTLLADDSGHLVPRTADIPLYDVPVFCNLTSADAPVVNIVGAGPAGLFAALTLLEHGIRPVIYERGKPVSERKRDIALLNRNEGFDPESNYCFGEGGAGTFSDGKLFSRSKKRGNMQRVMQIFHYFGAPDTVLYEAHAHIGSDVLPRIITRMRECILEHGGEIHFSSKVECLSDLWSPSSSAPLVLAIGHSAHDTYRMLLEDAVAMEPKGCAMGVRMEHPQELINEIFYHLRGKPDYERRQLLNLLGNASYSLVANIDDRGVYSFCMCPGGHIVPATAMSHSCVVNGMSASHRNSPYANSGLVVQLLPDDMTMLVDATDKQSLALGALEYQEHLEHLAYKHAGPAAEAPAQCLLDFVEGRPSDVLPPSSYLPGLLPSRLDQWLPRDISLRLRKGLRHFGRIYSGLLTNEAVLVGVESRTSSPVRILRDSLTMQSLSHSGVYPVGEGAGYAGGITSSALDGINAALAIAAGLGR